MIAPTRWKARTRLTRLLRLCAVTVTLGSTACLLPRPLREEAVPRRSPARDSLLTADLGRVDTLTARGLSGAMASYLAPDAVYLRSGAPPVYGRENVLTLLASIPASSGMVVTWQPVGGGVSRDAASGYTFGVAVYAMPERATPIVERYVAYWSRVNGGPWKIAAYAEVGSAAAAPLPGVAGIEVPRRVLSRQVQTVVQALMGADSAFADQVSLHGTAIGFSEAIADDGVLLAVPEFIVGSRAVREHFEALRGVSLSWRPIYAVGAGSGDLGFTIGEAVSTSRGPSGAAVQRFSKYLTVWRKEPNGLWKFVVDGGNSRPSPIGE